MISFSALELASPEIHLFLNDPGQWPNQHKPKAHNIRCTQERAKHHSKGE